MLVHSELLFVRFSVKGRLSTVTEVQNRINLNFYGFILRDLDISEFSKPGLRGKE